MSIKSYDNTDLFKSYRRFSLLSKEKSSPLQWIKINGFINNLALISQVLISIDNNLYIHGGVKTNSSTIPTNEFYKICCETFVVTNITTKDSPTLSQHASVVYQNRYIIFIGGWNGHDRLSKIFIYDTEKSKWLPEPSVTGFADRSGLSGHTTNICLKNSNQPEMIVIGREGSVRTQRKYGNVWKLKGNALLTKFEYGEISMHMDSRSNHGTVVIKNGLYVIGGRDDKVIDIHIIDHLIHDNYCKNVQKCFDKLADYKLTLCPTAGRRTASRRNHCTIPCSNGFVVLGGQSFMAGNDIANSLGFLYNIVDNNYYFLGCLENTRAKGAYTITKAGDAFYHGGIDENGMICGDILKLELIY